MATKIRKAKANGKAKAAGNLCLCGCGSPTKSRFAIGHDAKLKSRLINEAIGGSKKAEAEIKSLGWVAFLEKSRGSRDRKQAAKAAADKAKSAA